ncbi:hypothetical protein BOTBODRAFT_558763 [Botryobasidium botryosum FD-172 SS1]|uniref:Uncharacterized protein n=1 Tax=Botryobasidium botryosum (strain FD-172 SS1) TaxID=930990 RepID=A0A067LZU4_BOTB1|nr:hypothetical protein BOTBODRAFT_558763 [Botryobasidium botryosum FD-172 SS1]
METFADNLEPGPRAQSSPSKPSMPTALPQPQAPNLQDEGSPGEATTSNIPATNSGQVSGSNSNVAPTQEPSGSGSQAENQTNATVANSVSNAAGTASHLPNAAGYPPNAAGTNYAILQTQRGQLIIQTQRGQLIIQTQRGQLIIQT